MSAYVPTNVISITDGQIYLEANLFNAGIRPGVNVGISVSRVGGAAQTKAMRQVAGRLRLDMAAYRELAAFAQFGSDLDKATQGQLNRGRRMQEILKQPQYQPVSLEHQVMVIFAGTNGFASEVPVESMRQWEADLIKYLDTSHPGIGKDIVEKGRITEENEKDLRESTGNFQVHLASVENRGVDTYGFRTRDAAPNSERKKYIAGNACLAGGQRQQGAEGD